MINKIIVQKLVDLLYKCISFEQGEEPNFDDLKKLFADEALIIEYNDKDHREYIEKNIDRHIEGMNKVFNNHPEIKGKGFNEKELDNSIIISGPIAFVRSRYEKNYFNGKIYVKKIGVNCIQLASNMEKLKIISIGFYEE